MEVIKRDLKDIEKIAMENSEKIDKYSKTSESNAKMIMETIKKLHEHDEQIKKNSFAVEILQDMKKNSDSLANSNKRLCNIISMLSILLLIAIGFIIFLIVK